MLRTSIFPPSLSSIIMLSCVTQEGIRELQERIHHAAISAIDHDTREHIIGMQVHAHDVHM